MDSLFGKVDEDSSFDQRLENIKKEEDADSDMSDGIVVDEENKEASFTQVTVYHAYLFICVIM